MCGSYSRPSWRVGPPVLANRVLALVRKMLNFAVDQEWIDANPAAKLARPGGVEQSRERVLSHDELRAVLAYLDADPTRRRPRLSSSGTGDCNGPRSACGC